MNALRHVQWAALLLNLHLLSQLAYVLQLSKGDLQHRGCHKHAAVLAP